MMSGRSTFCLVGGAVETGSTNPSNGAFRIFCCCCCCCCDANAADTVFPVMAEMGEGVEEVKLAATSLERDLGLCD